jgi:tetratricopeptide (TPR) repeat protein
MDDLGALYWAQGKIERCGQMYQQTIPLLEQGLGDEQPGMIAEQRVKLARVYMAEKRSTDAVSLLQQAIPVLQRSGPSEREYLLQSLKNEALLLGELHRDSEVPRVQGQIDAILGIKAQSVEPMVRWQGLMGLLNRSTDLAQRGELLQQALAEAEKLGPGKEQAQTLEIFAAQQMGSNKNEQAEIYLKRALPMNERAFGAESVELAHNYEVLAVVYQTQNKLDLQESTLRQELTILEKLPKESVRLSIASQNLGDFYFRQKKFPEAETAYLQSFHAAEQSPPEVMMMSAEQRLGRLYSTWEKPEQAVTYYARTIALERSNPSPLYVNDLQTLSQLLRKLNRQNEAQQYDEERQQAIDHLMRTKATISPSK